MRTGRSSFRHALSLGRRFFFAAAVARLGVATSGLAVFWAVQGSSGSFGTAGVATGAFAVADALAGPQVARLVDRHGQRRVMPAVTALFAAAGLLLIVACSFAWPGMSAVVLSAVVGATVPPAGALSAARWRKVAPGDADGVLARALSMEGAVNDVVFLAGPVLVTTLGTVLAPWAGLVLAVSLLVAGMAVLLSDRASEPPPAGSSPGALMDRRLLNRRFAGLFAANLALGFFFGGIGVAITAFAFAHQAGALSGLITAAAGVVSLFAGLAYGAVAPGRPAPVMLVAGVVLTAGCAVLALTPSVPLMFAGYAVVGGCVALVLIPGSILLQQATVAEVYTQAMTWINSASALGIATSAPVVGFVVQHHGWPAGFLVLAALTACLPAAIAVLPTTAGLTQEAEAFPVVSGRGP
ncbi:MFS transporter [Actinoplanes subglobosus]|uniref:MFS transporter n=1 Tax=Actinoplanes subglobosus TaxID=1547892 RepID=A0ABV8IHR7_9ACTN